VAGEPAYLAVGTDAIWVGTTDQTLQRIDPGTGRVTATYRLGAALHGMASTGVAVDREPGRRHGLAGAAPRPGATMSTHL
jgi:hypothetical protein